MEPQNDTTKKAPGMTACLSVRLKTGETISGCWSVATETWDEFLERHGIGPDPRRPVDRHAG